MYGPALVYCPALEYGPALVHCPAFEYCPTLAYSPALMYCTFTLLLINRMSLLACQPRRQTLAVGLYKLSVL